jgi:uncharacterized protein (DUF1697 family)
MRKSIRYVALLRGINVGGHKPVKMEALDRVFASLKFKDIKTLIASGNVLFEGPGKGRELEGRIEKALLKGLGFEVPVMVRTLAQIEAILEANPFKRHPAGADVKNYVAFLSAEPDAKVRLPKCPAGERWEVLKMTPREIFITTRRKADGHFGFPNDFIEKGLGVSATTRNWNTVMRIVGA